MAQRTVDAYDSLYDYGTIGPEGNLRGRQLSGVTCGVHRTPLRVTHVTNTPLTRRWRFR